MATLQSYATTASNVVVNEAQRLITISNEVVEIDGALDAIGGAWRIFCRDSGGLRFLAGSSGTLGDDAVALTIIEHESAHRYGQDNYNGSNGRFVGGSCKFANVDWWTHCRSTGDLSNSRSDFDVGSGFAGEFNGLRHHAVGGYDGTADSVRCFTHLASSSLKLTRNAYTGYSIHFENPLNEACCEFVRPPAVAEADMVFIDDHPTNTTNAHVAFRLDNVADNGVMALAGVKARSIATINSSNNYSSRSVRLTDPVGDPPRLAWSNQYDGNVEIARTQRFSFTGVAVPANTALYAAAQAANGVSATGSASGAAGSVVVRTKYAADGSGTYLTQNTYRWQMVGRPFRKYATTANTAVSATPPAIAVALTADVLPDGTALTAYTGSAVADAGELYRALKDYALANRNEPSAAGEIAFINADGAIELGSGAQLRLDDEQASLVAETAAGIYSVKCADTGVAASNGITLLDAGSSNAIPIGTHDLLKLPIRDSAGTSARLLVSAHASEYLGIYTNAGAPLVNHSYAADGEQAFLIAASNAAASTRVGLLRAGYAYATRTLDLSAGGTIRLSFDALKAEVGPDGSALYDSSADTSGLATTSFTLTADKAKIRIGNGLVGVKAIYKKFHDDLLTPNGAKFAAFGRERLGINIDPYNGNALYLGANIQLRRASSGNSNAGVRAAVEGGVDGAPADTSNGEILYKPGSDIATIQQALLVDFDLDSVTPGTQSVAGLLTSMASHSDAAGGAFAAMRKQLRLIVQNLPLHFFDPWQPEIPAAFCLPGQTRLRDVEHRNWALASAGDFYMLQDGTGTGILPSANAKIRCSLNRGSGENVVNYAAECTLACRIKATELPSSGQLAALFTLGAMRIYVEPPNADGEAHLRVGSQAAGSSGHYIKLNEVFDVVVSMQRQDGSDNFPIVRLSTGPTGEGVAALQAWNDGSDEIFGSISSHAGYFDIGGGLKAEVSCCYFHPSDAEISYSWPSGDERGAVHWDNDGVDWHGLPSARDEGLATDLIEAQIIQILGKVYTLDEIAGAIISASNGQQPSNANSASLIALVKWLVANVNTTTPPTAAANADELMAREIETGIATRRALRLLLAEALGNKSVAGQRNTFHRLDSASTAAARGDVDDDGNRSNVEVLSE